MARVGKIWKAWLGMACAILALAACQQIPDTAQIDWAPYDCSARDVFPGSAWAKPETPEDIGWSSEALAEAQAYSTEIGSTAVVVVHRGIVVDAWGEIATKSNLHSVRKSLLSALIGIAVDEGAMDLSSSLAELGIDDNPPTLTPQEKTATVGDLIKSRSGVYHPALYETARMTASKPPRGSHPPGSFWHYNNWDFNTLGTIYERAVNDSIFTAFERRVAIPLQMEDFKANDGDYVTGSKSVHPAYPFRMTARDLARFAYLYLRDGRWEDRQIVSRGWVNESTTEYSVAYGSVGYSYMWWTLGHREAARKREGVPRGFFAPGWHGQIALVLPEHDAVIVHRVNTDRPHRAPQEWELRRLFRMIMEAWTGDPPPCGTASS